MLAVVEQIVEWLRPAFSFAGYPIVFGAVLLERSILLGLVVPGEVILALGGIYAGRGELSITVVIIGAIVAAILGESSGYWLGRRYGRSLIEKVPMMGRRAAEQMHKAEEYFEDAGGPTVAIGRYAVGAGAFVPFVAGMSRFPFLRFLAWDVPAITVWAAGVGLLGFYVGDNLDRVERILGRFGLVGLGVLAALVVGAVWWRRRHRARER